MKSLTTSLESLRSFDLKITQLGGKLAQVQPLQRKVRPVDCFLVVCQPLVPRSLVEHQQVLGTQALDKRQLLQGLEQVSTEIDSTDWVFVFMTDENVIYMVEV